jgi:hypothetical protein
VIAGDGPATRDTFFGVRLVPREPDADLDQICPRGLMRMATADFFLRAFGSLVGDGIGPVCEGCGREIGFHASGRPKTGRCGACRQREYRASRKPAAAGGV